MTNLIGMPGALFRAALDAAGDKGPKMGAGMALEARTGRPAHRAVGATVDKDVVAKRRAANKRARAARRNKGGRR